MSSKRERMSLGIGSGYGMMMVVDEDVHVLRTFILLATAPTETPHDKQHHRALYSIATLHTAFETKGGDEEFDFGYGHRPGSSRSEMSWLWPLVPPHLISPFHDFILATYLRPASCKMTNRTLGPSLA